MWLTVLLVAALTAIPLAAQVDKATISGTVTDSTGAVLVGAKVVAKNVETGIEQSAAADAQGRYRLPDVAIGTYQIEVSKEGFKSLVRKGVTLTIGSQSVIDFALSVGQTIEVVEVQSEVPQVETQSAAVGTLISMEQVRDLPLNGRNYTQLLSLAPGVLPIAPNGGVAGTQFYGSQTNFSASGSRPEGQAFLLDNTDIGNFWNHAVGSNGTGSSLGVESVQEFVLLTNTYGADYGGNGVVMNAATRSGTNNWHGSAYDFLRNSALDAHNFFDSPDQPKPAFRLNQFGASFGGPIKKDKAFFFFNYEGIRESQGQTSAFNVPMPYVSNGYLPCPLPPKNPDGSQPPPAPCADVQPPPPGTPPPPANCGVFTGQTLPNFCHFQGFSDPREVEILGFYPQPNAGAGDRGGLAQATEVGSQITHENYYLGRVDYHFSPNDALFGRYVFDKANLQSPTATDTSVPNIWEVGNGTVNQYLTVEEKHLFSPQVLNLARFTFVRTNEDGVNSGARSSNSAFKFVAAEPNRPDGDINIFGFGLLGAGTALPYYVVQNKFGGADDVVWTRGSHNFKFGAQVVRVQTNLSAPFELGGTYNFSGLQAFMTGSATFFLGVAPTQTDATRDFREIDIAPYFQDDWKVTPKLTLNLGVRYDFATNAVGVRHPLNNIPRVTPPVGNGFVSVEHVFASNPNVRNFDPRIGVAYDLFGDHKTSIRAGFGVFHNRVAPRTYASGYYFSPPFANSFIAVFIPPFFVPFPNAFPNCPPTCGTGGGPITQFAGVNYQIDRAPYQLQYNINLQREIFSKTVLTMAYVGAQGRRQFTQGDLNPSQQLPIGPGGSQAFGQRVNIPGLGPTDATNPRINSSGVYGGLDSITGTSNSNYNSMQVALVRQFARNIAGQLSYTWSHCLDNGSVSSGLEQFSFPRQYVLDTKNDYGNCSFDVRHNLAQNASFSLPFHGNRLVEGWQLFEILRVSTGIPVNILETFDRALLGAPINADRPSYSGASGCSPDHIVDKPVSIPGTKAIQWYDPACYRLQPLGTIGNVSRNTLMGPRTVNLDLAVLKETKITEDVRVQFRAEFYNVLNHPIFAVPDGTWATASSFGANPMDPTQDSPVLNPTSGWIQRTALPQREIQFALRFVF
jgi:hypothetical protein